MPVGEVTLGRIFNLLGETIDQGERDRGQGALADPPRRAGRHRPDADDRDVRDRHQGRRPARALRQGRQGRPLRRRRRRQDGDHPGAHPQPRPGARRPVGLLRRGRALARGQRPLAGDEGVGRHRQDDARLRPDERAARRAHARRAVRPDHGGVLPRAGSGRAALHRQHLPLRAGRLGGLRAAGAHALAGRLPADARDRDGPAAGAHHLHARGLGHLDPGHLRPGRRPHRPGAGLGLRPPQRDDDALALASRRRASTRPSTRSTRPRRSSSPTSSARSTTTSPPRSRRPCSATASCRTSSPSSASTSSPTRTRSPSSARARSSASCQPAVPRGRAVHGHAGHLRADRRDRALVPRGPRRQARRPARVGLLHEGRHRRGRLGGEQGSGRKDEPEAEAEAEPERGRGRAATRRGSRRRSDDGGDEG